MDKIILTTGMLSYITGILLISRSKKKFPNEAIIDYEKNIKPVFFKFFLFAFTPMLVLLVCLYTEYTNIINYLSTLILITLSLDLLAFYKLRTAIKASAYKTEFANFPVYFAAVIFGKITVLFALKLSLEALLRSS